MKFTHIHEGELLVSKACFERNDFENRYHLLDEGKELRDFQRMTINKKSLPEWKKDFRFGIEAEFLVAKADTFEPLWHKHLSFGFLNEIFESISLDGIPSLEGLELEAPATKLMPYVVEGYHLPDMDLQAREVLPKGVEIRTPVCASLEECSAVFRLLYTRLEKAMKEKNLALVSLSHHPTETGFTGPQNKRRHDYWQWSMEVMTTYGPDINVSLPKELAEKLDLIDLEAKINYYGPSLSAISVAAPFCGGEPWEMRGKTGKSFRMHKRSYIAPPVEFHPDEKNRLEFKVFDMPSSMREFEAQFLSFLALVLDSSLQGRASKQTRIYDLGQVARFGLQAEQMSERAEELLTKAPALLKEWGFDPAALEVFTDRLRSGRTPADDMIALYEKSGRNLRAVLEQRSRFLF